MDALARIFTYHKPSPEQLPKLEKLRAAALEFARVIEANVPNCADRSAAIRKIREAVMTANAALVLEGIV